ncbi:MAG TPA: hypothetical protein VGM79_24530 [Streptosporangiaceae bacterium]
MATPEPTGYSQLSPRASTCWPAELTRNATSARAAAWCWLDVSTAAPDTSSR